MFGALNLAGNFNNITQTTNVFRWVGFMFGWGLEFVLWGPVNECSTAEYLQHFEKRAIDKS